MAILRKKENIIYKIFCDLKEIAKTLETIEKHYSMEELKNLKKNYSVISPSPNILYIIEIIYPYLTFYEFNNLKKKYNLPPHT